MNEWVIAGIIVLVGAILARLALSCEREDREKERKLRERLDAMDNRICALQELGIINSRKINEIQEKGK